MPPATYLGTLLIGAGLLAFGEHLRHPWCFGVGLGMIGLTVLADNLATFLALHRGPRIPTDPDSP